MKFLLSKLSNKVLCIIILCFCFAQFLQIMYSCLRVSLGNVEINLETSPSIYEVTLLKGPIQDQDPFIVVPDKIYLSSTDKIDTLSWIGIASIGLLRLLPYAFCYLLFSKVFLNICKEKIFILQNINIALYCGAVLIIFSLLVPIFNYYLIPLLVNSFTNDKLQVTYNYLSNPNFIQGFLLLIAAYVFKAGNQLNLKDGET